MEQEYIEILGAAENNLRHVNVKIPKGKLVVLAGVSGSGKSSLAFDTLAVESSRQWQAGYPLYLRNRMPRYDRPAVDAIHNLTPAIVVDQKGIPCGSAQRRRRHRLLLQPPSGYVPGVYRPG